MITWTQVIFKGLSKSRMEDKNRVVQGGGLAVWGGGKCLLTCVEFTIFWDVWLNLCLLVLRLWIWNVELAHVDKVWISHHSWRAAFWLLAVASWLSLGSSLSLYPFLPALLRERLSLFLLSSIHSWLKVPLSSQGFPSPLHGEGKVQALIFPKCSSYDLYPQNAVAMGSHFLQRLFYLVHLKTLRNGDTLSYSDSLFRLFTKQH